MRIGTSEDLSFRVIGPRINVHDLHATLLHFLDRERLTFHHAGRDYRLTDVFGKVVKEILG